MLSRIERSIEHRSKGSVLAVPWGEDGRDASPPLRNGSDGPEVRYENATLFRFWRAGVRLRSWSLAEVDACVVGR